VREDLAKVGLLLMLAGTSVGVWLSTRIAPWEPGETLLWEWIALVPLAAGLGLLAAAVPDWPWWRRRQS
jgi:hypothetical protein